MTKSKTNRRASVIMRELSQTVRAQELGQNRAIKDLADRVSKLEKLTEAQAKRIERLKTRIANHTNSHKQRKYKRYVKHRLAPPEKAHICEIWAKHRHDPDTLEREGKKLARAYNLIYDRQVKRWFGRFEAMGRTELNRIRAERQ